MKDSPEANFPIHLPFLMTAKLTNKQIALPLIRKTENNLHLLVNQFCNF